MPISIIPRQFRPTRRWLKDLVERGALMQNDAGGEARVIGSRIPRSRQCHSDDLAVSKNGPLAQLTGKPLYTQAFTWESCLVKPLGLLACRGLAQMSQGIVHG